MVFSKWENIFANPIAPVMAMDGIEHHSVILEFDVPHYGTIDAQERQLHWIPSGQNIVAGQTLPRRGVAQREMIAFILTTSVPIPLASPSASWVKQRQFDRYIDKKAFQ